ncbi:YcjX family protein [Lacimicrobium alkaliphilum]|uniref:ATPase n=1 Tax=Lacimicrobium alkaliphilum TaxID=1526571 RepID=A0A0U3B853_9ALTE|nr:YcjX family protein [Lacimicrobium alkaliphilum]ALS97829.1 hypothetical protein AT746_05785 [Lacimicrobium alkaliphilum]
MTSSGLHHQALKKIRSKAQLVASRVTDQHIRLAVTGLSGAGKTAFITSLVNQLLEAGHGAELPFFTPSRQARLIGAQRASQPDLQLARFEYEQGMLSLNSDPPAWPLPTRGVSQIRINIRYQHAQSLRRILSDTATLVLDIIDYPGEWLLDLPLLEMDFERWSEFCEHQLHQPERHELAKDFLVQLQQTDWLAEGDEMHLKALADSYSDYLHACKDAGLELIQPGRFVLPGELEGAPILQFVPVPHAFRGGNASAIPDGSNLALVKERFRQYKEKVVKPFYRNYFRQFDRQIILVDCLSALNRGEQSFKELQQAINWLLKSFDYGNNSILRRLFASRIDKLVFAASKADHITPDQQDNLIRLLESMVHSARQDITYQGSKIQTTAFAAIRASQVGKTDYQGKTLSVLKGTDLKGKPVMLYPGDVPSCCPQGDFWQAQKFDFPAFAPPKRNPMSALPHIRMDQLLEFLLGDKLG